MCPTPRLQHTLSLATWLQDAEAFLDAWSKFDPQGTGWILPKDLPELVFSLPPPLGLNPKNYPYAHSSSASNHPLPTTPC